MSWAKFDDLYDDNRKVKRAWRRSRAAVGLHAMSVTYCARHDTDGVVDIDWIEDKLPAAKEREAVLKVLVETGLFEVLDDDRWRVHDYLEYHDTAEERARRREEERRRKSEAGKKGASARWGRGRAKPDSRPMAGAIGLPDTPNGTAMAAEKPSMAPDPTRPLPITPPGPPVGGRQRDKIAWEETATAFAHSVLPHLDQRQAFGEMGVIWMRMGHDAHNASADEVRQFIGKHKPHLLEGADAA